MKKFLTLILIVVSILYCNTLGTALGSNYKSSVETYPKIQSSRDNGSAKYGDDNEYYKTTIMSLQKNNNQVTVEVKYESHAHVPIRVAFHASASPSRPPKLTDENGVEWTNKRPSHVELQPSLPRIVTYTFSRTLGDISGKSFTLTAKSFVYSGKSYLHGIRIDNIPDGYTNSSNQGTKTSSTQGSVQNGGTQTTAYGCNTEKVFKAPPNGNTLTIKNTTWNILKIQVKLGNNTTIECNPYYNEKEFTLGKPESLIIHLNGQEAYFRRKTNPDNQNSSWGIWEHKACALSEDCEVKL